MSHSVGVVASLLSISKSTRAYVALLLAEIGLHAGQDQLLDRLDPSSAVSVSALADQLAVRPSTVSKMLDRLVDRDLIRRFSNEHDGRRTMIVLTPQGENVQRAVRAIWLTLEKDLIETVETTELEGLTNALALVDGLLKQKLHRLR